MSRSRAVREGAVGLLILGGMLTFAGLFVWIYNLRLGSQGYGFTLRYQAVSGLSEGSSLRLRGVNVGRVDQIVPGADSVRVSVSVNSLTPIPRNSIFTTSQTGLVGETVIDIKPSSPDPLSASAGSPLENCDPVQIICAGDELEGTPGVDFADLLTVFDQLSRRVNTDEFFTGLDSTLAAVAAVSEEVASLSNALEAAVTDLDLTRLDLGEFTAAAQSTQQVAAAIGETATTLQTVTTQVGQALTENRQRLDVSLANVEALTTNLRQVSESLQPMLTDPQLQASLRQSITDIQTASSNVAELTEQANQLMAQLNDPGTMPLSGKPWIQPAPPLRMPKKSVPTSMN
ncbi:MAG: MCE family protein [Synechococcaceae cyanobacterium RM1_1_27]|nr:MCE family protein [Synechococcaceae cyanobacterium RM1_1_27]